MTVAVIMTVITAILHVTTVSKIIVGICDQRRCYYYCCYSLPFLVDYLLMVLITLHMHFALTDGM